MCYIITSISPQSSSSHPPPWSASSGCVRLVSTGSGSDLVWTVGFVDSTVELCAPPDNEGFSFILNTQLGSSELISVFLWKI